MQHEGDSAFLFENEVKNFGKKASGSRYDEKMKAFALTLHYYSPKAYNYIRFASLIFELGTFNMDYKQKIKLV